MNGHKPSIGLHAFSTTSSLIAAWQAEFTYVEQKGNIYSRAVNNSMSITFHYSDIETNPAASLNVFFASSPSAQLSLQVMTHSMQSDLLMKTIVDSLFPSITDHYFRPSLSLSLTHTHTHTHICFHTTFPRFEWLSGSPLLIRG